MWVKYWCRIVSNPEWDPFAFNFSLHQPSILFLKTISCTIFLDSCERLKRGNQGGKLIYWNPKSNNYCTRQSQNLYSHIQDTLMYQSLGLTVSMIELYENLTRKITLQSLTWVLHATKLKITTAANISKPQSVKCQRWNGVEQDPFPFHFFLWHQPSILFLKIIACTIFLESCERLKRGHEGRKMYYNEISKAITIAQDKVKIFISTHMINLCINH